MSTAGLLQQALNTAGVRVGAVHAVTRVGANEHREGPPRAGSAPPGGILRQAQDERNSVSERGGSSSQQGPRDWLCQTAGAAAPSGGSALHAVKSVGATRCSA